MDKLLPGITSERVDTDRLTVAVLSVTGRDGQAVLFVHGNVSSSLFWQPTMLALPEGYRPLAIDLRGFGDTDPEPVDATRGLRDYADDLDAAIDALGLDLVHLVGWSMGGGVVLQYLVDRPGSHRVASLTLVDPVSPFGFGGTKGVEGTLCDPSGAGSGGGAGNPEFVERLAGRDRTDDSVLSPRRVLLAHYVKPPHVPDHLDILVESMLSTRTGEYYYPGDSRPVDAWPGFAPGDHGVLNTMAPTHFRIDDLSAVQRKPPLLWLRGADDVIVSDTSLYDLAYLGSIGAVPGWPGDQAFPPQPMVAQTRAVLDGYAAAGGRYREVVIEDSGHGPHLDQPERFRAELVGHLDAAGPGGSLPWIDDRKYGQVKGLES
jgi:pimeloyl-ACP methyl ester carboxylesterase